MQLASAVKKVIVTEELSVQAHLYTQAQKGERAQQCRTKIGWLNRANFDSTLNCVAALFF